MNVWKGIKNIVVTTLLIATEKRMEMAEEEAEFLVKKYEDVKHEDIVETMQKKDMEGIDRTLRIHFEDTRKTVLDILFK